MNDVPLPRSPHTNTGIAGAARAVAAAQLASQLISLLVVAALWRLVDPGQFGLMAMVMPWVMLLRMLSTSGLFAAAVQRTDLSSRQLSTLFWWQLCLGAVTTALLAAGGPLLAWVSGAKPVTALAAALSATIILAALGNLHEALLQRELHMGRLVVVRLAAQLVGAAVGIAAAVAGWGVWALVMQQYGEMFVLAAGLWFVQPWRPALPHRGTSVQSLLRFGGYYSLSGLMFYVGQNIDKVLLSVLLGGSPAGRAAVGLYWQAYQFMMKPVYLVTTPATAIMLPALSQASAEPRRFAELTVRFYRLVSIALAPATAGLIVVAPRLMPVLGGESWAPAGRILQVLAIAVLAQGMINIAGSVLTAAGRADRLFFGSVIITLVLGQAYLAGYSLAVLIPGDAPALTQTLGVAWGLAAATAGVLLLPYLYYCFSIAGISMHPIWISLRWPIAAAAAMGVSVEMIGILLAKFAGLGDAAVLAIQVPAGVVIFGLFARRDLAWFVQQIRGADDF